MHHGPHEWPLCWIWCYCYVSPRTSREAQLTLFYSWIILSYFSNCTNCLAGLPLNSDLTSLNKTSSLQVKWVPSCGLLTNFSIRYRLRFLKYEKLIYNTSGFNHTELLLVSPEKLRAVSPDKIWKWLICLPTYSSWKFLRMIKQCRTSVIRKICPCGRKRPNKN